MRILIFDLRGELAHFRRPDTMGTQATYPFITRTALRGLIAAILGFDYEQLLPPEVRCGIRLLSSVSTVAQELSMHGKTWVAGGDEKSFHRPTAIELVVKPHYRIYYAGPLIEELSQRIKNGQSKYHTYLGSAYCLTFPQWVNDYPDATSLSIHNELLSCVTVVPSPAVRKLILQQDEQYARIGGILWEYIGDRRFRGTVSLLYEVNGGTLHFFPSTNVSNPLWQFCKIDGEGVVCLW